MFRTIRDYLALKNYQYEVTTALYMLEPWEKALFNTLVLVGLALFTYTTVYYLPEQLTYFASRISEYTSSYR
nr:7502_t:CDS:2 [Entrophospora candida]